MYQKMFGTNYSDGFENRVDRLKRNGQDQTKWTNPLEFRASSFLLPPAFFAYRAGWPS